MCESFEKEIYGYSFDVLLIGITDDNPFFDTGELPDNDTDVVISSAVANKYNLFVGDVFTLNDTDNDRLYAFRVEKIIDYAASLMVFMDIDHCRDLFGEDNIKKAAGIFVDQMRSMILIMSIASAVIFVVVLYLMLKMMLDRSTFNI
nr:ABC transporter permease [Saccharofermentans sp.]